MTMLLGLTILSEKPGQTRLAFRGTRATFGQRHRGLARLRQSLLFATPAQTTENKAEASPGLLAG